MTATERSPWDANVPSPARKSIWPIIGAVAALVILGVVLFAACGAPATGDVEGQVLGMKSASEQPVLLSDAAVVIAGNNLNCGARADRCVTHTDTSGRYRLSNVPTGSYAVAFNAPDLNGTSLQDEARQITVSANKTETVSVVLLAEGMERPQVPPELSALPRPGQPGYNGSGYNGGLSNNPFFWYWVFNQPWVGGYSRPPVVVVNPDRTIVVDRQSTTTTTSSTGGRTYTNYSPTTGGQSGSKPAPEPIDSKGVIRPGTSALPGGSTSSSASSTTSRNSTNTTSTSSNATSSSSNTDASKGTTRPGQAVTGGSVRTSGSAADANSVRSSGSGTSSSNSTSTTPPRVSSSGSGGSSGTSTSSSPPRVNSPGSSSSSSSSSPPRVSSGSSSSSSSARSSSSSSSRSSGSVRSSPPRVSSGRR